MVEYNDKNSKEIQRTILLVDDSITVRELLSLSCRKESYSVLQARDGQEALEICETIHVDLIILDIEMPRVDGFEFLARVKDWIETPIIMLTSRGASKHRQLAMELGACEYFVKPYSEKELLHTIKKIINANSKQIELIQLAFINEVIKYENEILKQEKEILEQENEILKREGKIEFANNFDKDKYEAILGAAIHSIKNEFFSISAAKDEILEIADNNYEIEEECENIKRSINYSQVIVKRLFAFLDMNTFKFQMVDITNLLNEIELIAKPRMLSFVDLQFMIDSHVKSYQINTDPEQLKMVLLELIENAKKSFSGMNSGKIKIEAIKRENEILIFVKDNGSGIPNEVKNKLFAEKVISNKGTGLGLFLCSKVIQELKGKLTFLDVDDPGAEFLISLPCKQ